LGLVVTAMMAVGAGCEEGEAPRPAPPEQPTPPRNEVVAVRPPDGAREIAVRPRFKWELPGSLKAATYVGFELRRVSGPDQTGRDQGMEVALASGLDDTTPTALNPFNPPDGVIVTGMLRDAGRLEPGTWYRWTVTAMAPGATGQGMFFFRTTETPEPAPPEPPPDSERGN
jgi:hypothetical protein